MKLFLNITRITIGILCIVLALVVGMEKNIPGIISAIFILIAAVIILRDKYFSKGDASK